MNNDLEIECLELNKIYQGECREMMKDIPDKSIDLILTDPPYGIGESNEQNLSRINTTNKTIPKDYGHYDWDEKSITKEYIDEIIRISKNQIIFGGNYYADLLPPSSCWIVWNKLNTGDFADCELAWTSFKTAVRIFNWRWNGFIQHEMGYKKEIRYHPTQKPVKLFEWIINKYSKEGDLIMDCFAGSGTTGIACVNLNRNYILIEKQEKYCEIARKRIDEASRQMRIFT